MPQSLTWK